MDYITPGSYFQGQITYAHGAIRYLAHTPFGANSYTRFSNDAPSGPFQGSVGLGLVMDGAFTSPGGFGFGGLSAALPNVDLVSGWTLNLAYEHVWNPKWKTSVYGGYTQINYGAGTNWHICNGNAGNLVFGNALGGQAAVVNPAASGCDADWSTWWIGSRTQWNITPQFYMGVDVLYQRLNTMNGPAGANWVLTTPGAPRPTGTYLLDDQSVLGATFRAHFDFLP
jgi:hypothetical protein